MYKQIALFVLGPVNTILSWNALLPLTRLTYTMYLIHPIVISWWALRQRQPFYHTTENMVGISLYFVGGLVVTSCFYERLHKVGNDVN